MTRPLATNLIQAAFLAALIYVGLLLFLLLTSRAAIYPFLHDSDVRAPAGLPGVSLTEISTDARVTLAWVVPPEPGAARQSLGGAARCPRGDAGGAWPMTSSRPGGRWDRPAPARRRLLFLAKSHRQPSGPATRAAREAAMLTSSTNGTEASCTHHPSGGPRRGPERGVFIEDRDGKRLLDAFAGLYCVNVGYGRPEIAEAIAEQAHKLAYYHAYVGHGTEASITLAKMIVDRAPKHMSKVYFGLGGSDANETNVKLVWYVNNVLGRPEKRKIISRWRGYHGSGLITGSLTGLKLFHDKFGLPMAEVIHTEAPYYFRRPGRDERGRVHRPLRGRAGGADRARGRRHHRRLHRRADTGHGRHRAAARRLLGGDPADPAPHDILLIATRWSPASAGWAR
jgi:hypothetical protein